MGCFALYDPERGSSATIAKQPDDCIRIQACACRTLDFAWSVWIADNLDVCHFRRSLRRRRRHPPHPNSRPELAYRDRHAVRVCQSARNSCDKEPRLCTPLWLHLNRPRLKRESLISLNYGTRHHSGKRYDRRCGNRSTFARKNIESSS